MLTYGNRGSNLDIRCLLKFHQTQGKLATITVIRPPARFWGFGFNGNLFAQFAEKPQVTTMFKILVAMISFLAVLIYLVNKLVN